MARNDEPAAQRPIRVLHLRDSPWVDGPGRTILDTGSHLDRSRVEYHIAVLVGLIRGPRNRSAIFQIRLALVCAMAASSSLIGDWCETTGSYPGVEIVGRN